MFSKSAILAAVLSHAVPTLAVVHERLAALPTGWTVTGAADVTSTLTFTIALTQQNIDQLESRLLAVSTPGSASYGKYLEHDELNALFAPTAGASSAVESWLKRAGVSQISSDGAYVTFATTVGTANSLLNTTFSKYEHSAGAGVKIRTTQYSVPEELADYIDLIDPTIFVGKAAVAPPTYSTVTPSKVKTDAATKSTIDASCSTSITPTCLKQLYNTVGYTPDPHSGSRIGFGSFLNQSAVYSDLFSFEDHFNIPHQNFSTILVPDSGATNDQDITTAQLGEANLDIQNIIGVAHPLPVTEFITGGSPPFIPNALYPTAADNQNEPYLQYYKYLLSQSNKVLPQVISNSYGDDEQTVPEKYAVKVCNMIGMMGLRGISVLESSGDNGVGAPCLSNDGKKTLQFTPEFPGTCPYITAVGGTVAVSPEQAWEGSAGGFSNYFARPAYQNHAIEQYVDHELSPAVKKYYEPYTNFKGRGFPDISAHSVTPDYEVVYAGQLSPSGGTSAASPVLAAIIGLLNDARFRAGKPSLGFINPLLYTLGQNTLNDITLGGSIGCNGKSYQSGKSIPGGGIIPWATWNATKGWDPVTGLGTPNFQKLKALVLAL